MADNDAVDGPENEAVEEVVTDPPEVLVADTATVPPAAPAPAAPRLRDRAFSLRAVIAVGVATLLIGGAGGAAIVAATDDDHDGHRMSRFSDGPGRDGRGPGGYGRHGGGPQLRQNGPGDGPDIEQYGGQDGAVPGPPQPPYGSNG